VYVFAFCSPSEIFRKFPEIVNPQHFPYFHFNIPVEIKHLPARAPDEKARHEARKRFFADFKKIVHLL
jgi:hypothetical protein